MSGIQHKFRVAIFDQFLESFAKIPRAQQKKVHKFIRLFRSNPTSRSINYERVHDFVDPNMRTVRIGDDYRAIMLKPDKGNVYVLLWVDHHDEAMRWARNKRCAVHPETGGLQVFTEEPAAPVVPMVEQAVATAEPVVEPVAPPLFHALERQAILGLGVPEALLERVIACSDLEQLEGLAGKLPPEAFEALYFVADGEPLEVVREALGFDTPSKDVDPEDIAAALDSEASKRSFALLTDDDELAAMLDAPLEKWRVFLHPSQRKLVNRPWNGPVRVLGGAGTGKTVVAMHRAAWLVQYAFPGKNDRILYTTFTRNLAADIKSNLAKLAPNEALKRIEVVHLDRWIADFLRRQGYAYTIDYYRRGSGRLWEHWCAAIGSKPDLPYPTSFYREEWEYVVQSHGCRTRDEYLRANRAGRGVRMSRRQRRAVWPVFEEYRNLLEDAGLKESEDAIRDAAGLLKRKDAVLGYRSILVDEAQDMSTNAFRLLRLMVPECKNDLFIVGDGHQRIYRRKVVLGHAGVKIVGRSHRLRINYRTTDEIRRFGVAMLEGIQADDLDGGTDTTRGYRSLVHGEEPQVSCSTSFTEEVDAIVAFIGDEDPAHHCLVVRTNKLLEHYERALNERGVESYRLRRSTAEDTGAPGVRLATMHRVKGLEFDRVVIAGINRNVVPLRLALESTKDKAVRRDHELQERALLYVATTRARHEVMICSWGEPSEWLALWMDE